VSLPHPRTGVLFGSPVPPGSGWPGDPATPDTPVARDAGQVAALADAAGDIGTLDAEVSVCRACPRLVGWREDVAVVKRRAFAEQPYWGRPAAGWGASQPRILVLGLAPAAHGANRTGRVFTGDRSGDQLFAALHRCGLVNSPQSVDAADGLRANGIRVAAAVRCAPPGNKPETSEEAACRPFLTARLAALPLLRWQGPERLEELIDHCRQLGAVIFNPHAITVEEGGLGVVDADQVAAKAAYDPAGLLNPGKLRGWQER
jgi:uracil-DNA glycosylase